MSGMPEKPYNRAGLPVVAPSSPDGFFNRENPIMQMTQQQLIDTFGELGSGYGRYRTFTLDNPSVPGMRMELIVNTDTGASAAIHRRLLSSGPGPSDGGTLKRYRLDVVTAIQTDPTKPAFETATAPASLEFTAEVDKNDSLPTRERADAATVSMQRSLKGVSPEVLLKLAHIFGTVEMSNQYSSPDQDYRDLAEFLVGTSI